MGPIGDTAPRRTGRQNVGRNITWNWTCVIALKLQTRPLVREGAPHQQTRTCLKIIKKRREKIGRGFQMGAWHQGGLADWLSVVI
jgi:hypothetical protein